MIIARDRFIRRSDFARRAHLILAGGLLLGSIASPTRAVERSPAGIDQSSFVSIGGIETQFDLLLAKARQDGDEATVKQLEAIGRPDPANATQYFKFRKGLSAVMAGSDQAWLKSLRANATAMMSTDPKDIQNLPDGMDFSAKHVLPDQMATDLPSTADKIDTAFFVIQGRDDVVTPTKAAIDYFTRVNAPKKELILIPDAGHFAFMTAADAFLTALTDKVRPIAIMRGG